MKLRPATIIPVLILLLLVGANFMYQEVEGIESYLFFLWVINAAVVTVCGWMMYEPDNLKSGIKKVLFMSVLAGIINIAFNVLWNRFIYGKLQPVELLATRLAQDILSFVFGSLGLMMHHISIIEEQHALLKAVNDNYTKLFSENVSISDLRLQEAENDANRIINEAKLEAKLAYAKKDEFMREMRAVISSEIELIKKLETEE